MTDTAPGLRDRSRRRFVACLWLGAALLAWWYFVGPGLRGPAAEALLAKPISALCIIVLAAGGWIRSRRNAVTPPLLSLLACAGVGTVVALNVIIDIAYVAGIYRLPSSLVPYLQPSPLTALGLLAIAVALAPPRTERGIQVTQTAALVAAALGLATLMAYLYGSPLPAGILRGPVDASLPSGVGLLLLGLGAALDEPNRGFIRYLTGNLPTQEATRRLAIATVTIPLVGGWIGVLLIRSGATSPSLGVAFVVTLTFTAWGALVWWTGRRLTELQLKELAMQQDLKDRVLARTLDLELAMRELDAFNHSVSHDLRSPTRNIRLLLQTLREDHGEAFDKGAKAVLNDLDRITLDLQQKLAALSELARAGQSEVKRVPIDASALAHEILDRLQEQDAARAFQSKIEPDVFVHADRALFAILMENLLGNAWKFTRDANPSVIEFGLDASNGRRAYFIRDNGVGFESADARTLFRPFRRLHPGFEGTGIGLATVARIVRRHGGTIEAEGQPSRGATFRFTLGKADQASAAPASDTSAVSPPAVPASGAVPSGG